MIGGAQRFAKELGMKPELRCLDSSGTTEQGEVIRAERLECGQRKQYRVSALRMLKKRNGRGS